MYFVKKRQGEFILLDNQVFKNSTTNLFFKNYKSIGSFLVAKYSIFSKNLLMNDLAVGHIEKISI